MHKSLVYDVDEVPPVREGLALGAQHLVAMLLGNITPPLLIAGALGLAAGQTGMLVQAVLLVAGLSTLVQAYPIGPVGGRIPIVMGTSIAFVGGSIAIGSRAGLAAVFGACLAAAVVEVVIGFSFSRVRRWFPPVVTSVVVMLIGLTLIPVGVDYAAGGIGAEDYGSPLNLGIAFVVLLVTLILNQYASGLLAYASVLARYAARQVRAVRRAAAPLNVRSVSFVHCQQSTGIRLERLDSHCRRTGAWMPVTSGRVSTLADVDAWIRQKVGAPPRQ